MPYLGRLKAQFLLSPAVLLTVLLLLFPLIYLLQYSFFVGDATMGETPVLSLANYGEVLQPYYLQIIGKTLWLSLCVTVIVLMIGFPLAALMWRASAIWRSPLTILVLSPLLVSMVASSYGWIVILGDKGVINETLLSLGLISGPIKLLYTDVAIVIGLVHIVLPFMVLSLLASLDRIESYLEEAAAMLGANRFRVWWEILLPLCLPGIGAGITLVFALSISAYVTPAVLGPSGPNFITSLIYQAFVSLYEWGLGSALAVVLLVVATVIVLSFSLLLARVSPTREATK